MSSSDSYDEFIPFDSVEDDDVEEIEVEFQEQVIDEDISVINSHTAYAQILTLLLPRYTGRKERFIDRKVKGFVNTLFEPVNGTHAPEIYGSVLPVIDVVKYYTETNAGTQFVVNQERSQPTTSFSIAKPFVVEDPAYYYSPVRNQEAYLFVNEDMYHNIRVLKDDIVNVWFTA